VEEDFEQEGEDAGQRSAKSSGASRETTPRSQRSFKSAGASRDHHGKAPKGPKDTPKHPDSQQRLWGTSGLEEVRPKTRQLVHLARFAHFMQLWQPFDTQSKNCTGIGLLSLVQGATYFCLGALTTEDSLFSSAEALKAALIMLIMMAIFTFIVVKVYDSSARFKFTLTRWCVLVLFCSAPAAAWAATVAGDESSGVRQALVPICSLLHSLLFLVGYIQSFAEMKMPSEITQKYITGTNGQQFTDFAGKDKGQVKSQDIESGVDVRAPMDLSHITPQEEAQAAEIRESVRRSVRGSLILASAAWFCLFLAYLVDAVQLFRVAPTATDLTEIPVTWPSSSVYPHAFVYAGSEAFAANKFRVFRITFSEGKAHAQAIACPLDGSIADITAVCEGHRVPLRWLHRRHYGRVRRGWLRLLPTAGSIGRRWLPSDDLQRLGGTDHGVAFAARLLLSTSRSPGPPGRVGGWRRRKRRRGAAARQRILVGAAR
jgi:hypothetical protein